MWEPAIAVALSVFLTCTLFFTIYGLAFLGLKLSLKALKNIKKLIKSTKEE